MIADKDIITEAQLKQLLHSTLPMSDLASVPDETYDSYIQHALFLRRSSPYCRDIPLEQFLHFVFYPRINTEDLVPCRPFFYELLKERIRGMDAKDAALEVNRWCAEHVTYQASDDRTKNPITAYRSGIGRCGEESTFTVSALRSVGIPARQVYVPYWAHCDDNHAWVEVLIDGKWYYLGACEPEPVLNRGWFTDAASRAPMVFYRTFFDCADDEPVGSEGTVRLYSVLKRYAETTILTIQSAPGAQIRLEVVNMAALRFIAGGTADSEGVLRLHVGRGTYRIEARTETICAEAFVVIEDKPVTVKPQPMAAGEEILDIDWISPAAAPGRSLRLTPAQEALGKQTALKCAEIREQSRLPYDTLFDPDPELQAILRIAGANACEIRGFLEQIPISDRDLAISFLQIISSKDLTDTSCETLLHHWNASLPYRNCPHFVKYILNPRIGNEKITQWRWAAAALYDPDVLTPEAFYQQLSLKSSKDYSRIYPGLTIAPEFFERLDTLDSVGIDFAFVAALRSRGIPARRNPVDGIPEYRKDDRWHPVSGERTALLEIQNEDAFLPVHGVHYTLSRQEDTGFRVLNSWDGQALPLVPGNYRLVSTNRLPNGNQLCRIHRFSIAEGEHRRITLKLRQAAPEQMLASGLLEPFFLHHLNGATLTSTDFIQRKTLLCYLHPGQEPTEHILNELMAVQDHLPLICFIIQNPSQRFDPLLCKAASKIPESRILLDCGNAQLHARKMFLEPDVFPLLILTDPSHRGYFGTYGYNVGSVDLALRLCAII